MNGKARPLGSALAFTEGDGRTLGYAKGDEVGCRAQLWRCQRQFVRLLRAQVSQV